MNDEPEKNSAGEAADDTKTRKTMRLRPTVAAASFNLKAAPAPGSTRKLDALDKRSDTSTGNIAVTDDTRTRRTVRLQPLNTVSVPDSVAAPQPRTDAVPGAGPDTRTRKLVPMPPEDEDVTRTQKIKPRPAGNVFTNKPYSGFNTNTRRTVVLNPNAGDAPGNTNTRRTVVLRNNDDTRTGKISRPASGYAKPLDIKIDTDDENEPQSMTFHTKTGISNVIIPAQVKKTPGVSDEEIHIGTGMDDKTVKLSRPVKPGMLPKAGAVAEDKIVDAEKRKKALKALLDDDDEIVLKGETEKTDLPENSSQEEQTIQTVHLDEEPSESESEDIAPDESAVEGNFAVTAESADKPSVFYTAAGAVALLLLVLSAVMIVIQYLNLFQGKNIQLF